MLLCPTHKTYHNKGRSFERSQTDGGRQYGPCPVRVVQRDSQQHGSFPSRTADTADSELKKHRFPELVGFEWAWLAVTRRKTIPW